MDLVADLSLIEPMMRRCLALDETYRGGAAHEFMVAFEGGRHEAQGGSVARARDHYVRAMARTDGRRLYVRAMARTDGRRLSVMVSLAEHVAVRLGDRREFEGLLHQALAFDVDTAPDQRLANLIAQRRAALLLSQADDLFLGDEG